MMHTIVTETNLSLYIVAFSIPVLDSFINAPVLELAEKIMSDDRALPTLLPHIPVKELDERIRSDNEDAYSLNYSPTE